MRKIERRRTYRRALAVWGRDSQLFMVMEELGEVLAAGGQYRRGRVNEIKSIEEIVTAAEELFDNRLGWSDGRPPYAPPEFWTRLGLALDRPMTGVVKCVQCSHKWIQKVPANRTFPIECPVCHEAAGHPATEVDRD